MTLKTESDSLQNVPHLRRLMVSLLVLAAGLYAIFTIAPFFVLGLHQQPANLIIGGLFDPKGLPGLNQVVHLIGFALILIAPAIIFVVAPPLLLLTWRRWSQIALTERRFISSISLASLALLVFMLTSPLARLIRIWWLD